jgi:hypothetical protein
MIPLVRRRVDSPHPDDLLVAAVNGVIRARDLVELGVPETTMYRRCRDGGPWQGLAPGIVLMTTGHPTPDQLATAALMHGGPDCMITGLHACHRYGVRRGPQLPATEQEKRARFAAVGVKVLPTLPRRMRSHRTEVLDELCRAYKAAASRPRPDVRATPPSNERQQGGDTGATRQ